MDNYILYVNQQMNINCHLNHKTFNPAPREEPKIKQNIKSLCSQLAETILKCPKCSSNSKLMCYACCLEISCAKCHDYEHFTHCKKQFNKFSFSLQNSQLIVDLRSKKNKKNQSSIQKCKRCESFCQDFQYCQTCKISICLKCSTQMHSKGKFNHHQRFSILQFEKRDKKLSTLGSQVQEIDENIMRKSRRQNIQNNEYGFKSKNKGKMPATPVTNKRQKSTSRSNQNQQNMVSSLKKSKKGQNINIVDIAQQTKQIDKQAQHPWLNCKTHNKTRNILTQTYDLICQSCHDELKPNTTSQKKKPLDIESLLKPKQPSQSQLKQTINYTIIELNLKISQLNQQFNTYKQQLSKQYHKNIDLLQQKYKQNQYNMQKWHKNYQQNLKIIINQYESIQMYEDYSTTIACKEQSNRQLVNIVNLKIIIALQEGLKMKKDYYMQLEQYYFKVNSINHQEFQDIIKNYTFARRKSQLQPSQYTNQKSLSKISQTNPLKQSRVSNPSFTTDRKNLKRQDSLLKSSYYELSSSNNLIKKSQFRQDISQKILFPNHINSHIIKNDKKQIIKKIQSKNQGIRQSQYFFDSINDERHKKQKQYTKQIIDLPTITFKDIKYIDLQNFMAQKTQKQISNNSYDQSSYHQLSQKTFDQNESIDRNTKKSNDDNVSVTGIDSKITYSIIQSNTEGQAGYKTTNQSLANSAVNINMGSMNSSVCNKTKRKSDYMQMRDRLRKPNYLHKLK